MSFRTVIMVTFYLPDCVSQCRPLQNTVVSPNDIYADATIGTMLHEMAEIVTSPDEDAWQDGIYQEFMDKYNVFIFNLVQIRKHWHLDTGAYSNAFS
jgi:hypothetical protein